MRNSPYRAPHINPDKIAMARHLRREMTPTEKALWARLRGNRLDGVHFRRQVVIEGYVADFYCHAARLVIEVDGGVHENQRGYDDLRDQVMASRGYRVLRIATGEIDEDIEAVLRRILEKVKTQ